MTKPRSPNFKKSSDALGLTILSYKSNELVSPFEIFSEIGTYEVLPLGRQATNFLNAYKEVSLPKPIL